MDFVNAAASVIKSIRIQDIVDMAIIAGMIFALLMWFKTRASRFVLIGILLLGGVYLAARFFQLYLTVIVLQGFFGILLFVLVVIFQEDLRGFFERLAMLGNLRKATPPLSDMEKAVGVIAETAGNLAKKRIGALMVIQGDDPLDRHLTGGVELNGVISEPLLASIFDPHSSGHDGAAVIKGARITMFGCHLPLSVNIEQYENIGLRHTAALGLTERSDALCIVVSEERGTISIAQGESLAVIPGASMLNEILEKYYTSYQPAPQARPVWAWLRENTKEKIMAVGLACVLWVAFGYQRDIVRRDFLVPIDYKNVPQNWQIDEPQLTEAKVIFQGPDQAFRLLDEKSLRLSLDLASLVEKKREFTLTKDMVNAPSSLSIADISPSKIRVYASKQVSATLPVHVVTRNRLPDNLTLQKIMLSPAKIRVMMDSRMKSEEINLETEPIDLQNISSSVAIALKVVPTTGVSFPDGQALQVRATIRVKKK
ncbi:MAG TPA: diadenylate cyclase [Smithellaceae bacterium]|nr:diadenylate cyclase [Smithellaceae bacterium]HRY38854.1 diadenylate cyclase [Smithellaceae bacterium]